MNIVFLGSEVPSNRKLLIDQGVTNFGFSYMRAFKRGFPKTKTFSFWDYYPVGSRIVVHPGITEVGAEYESIAADYQDFVMSHIDDVAGVVEFSGPKIDPNWVSGQRPFWQEAGGLYQPVWNPDLGYRDLVVLSEQYTDIAIPSVDALGNGAHQITAHMRGMVQRLGTHFHGLAIASPDTLAQSPLVTASTLSWASPMMRGETIVWDGQRLVRYPKNMKQQSRLRYKNVIETAGFNYEAILADDNKETTRLAIWSYRQLEIDMDKKKPGSNPFTVIKGGGDVDNNDDIMTALGGSQFGDVDNRAVEEVKPQRRTPAPRDPSERMYLPVMGVESKQVVEVGEDGRDTLKEVPILVSNSSSLRQCNTCVVSGNCPAFTPDTACAFSLPVEVRTKEQLKSLVQAIIEMQGSRVAFAKFTEDLNGGYPDPNVSQEIDRLFKLLESASKIGESKDSINIHVERSGSAGVLSAIFGDRAQALRELDNGPIDPIQIIQQTLTDQ